ncbi:hypothetical protein ACRALDRAFT_2020838 [Sodiomyces alcalophilus JCM 7366]|uniref:uncharacterized protein n=1 Tax=Sodiomyces alcalophilus JCM 7366 TaxID=591952 RepID=UPI0039B4C2E6
MHVVLKVRCHGEEGRKEWKWNDGREGWAGHETVRSAVQWRRLPYTTDGRDGHDIDAMLRIDLYKPYIRGEGKAAVCDVGAKSFPHIPATQRIGLDPRGATTGRVSSPSRPGPRVNTAY